LPFSLARRWQRLMVRRYVPFLSHLLIERMPTFYTLPVRRRGCMSLFRFLLFGAKFTWLSLGSG
jgi:hypothetical protein